MVVRHRRTTHKFHECIRDISGRSRAISEILFYFLLHIFHHHFYLIHDARGGAHPRGREFNFHRAHMA